MAKYPTLEGLFNAFLKRELFSLHLPTIDTAFRYIWSAGIKSLGVTSKEMKLLEDYVRSNPYRYPFRMTKGKLESFMGVKLYLNG